jgi:hypothetical protein
MNREDKIRALLLTIAIVWVIWAMAATFGNNRPQQPGPNDIRTIYTR